VNAFRADLDLSVPACASEPRSDGGLTVAEDPFGSGSIQPTGSRREHHGNLLGGGFQTVEGGVAPGSESRVTGRASKGLDLLDLTMPAIANQRMDVSISDPEVRALPVGTSEAFGVYPLGCSPAAFHLTPGARLPQEQVSRLRSRGDRWDNQAGCVA
jgi:hypothetical protein